MTQLVVHAEVWVEGRGLVLVVRPEDNPDQDLTQLLGREVQIGPGYDRTYEVVSIESLMTPVGLKARPVGLLVRPGAIARAIECL